MNTQNWSPSGWTGWISLQSKGLSRVFSNTTVLKHQFSMLSFLYSPTVTSIHDCFKPTFSPSSFTFIKRLFSSSSLSAIRVVSSASLRLLIFLPAILIPAYACSSPAFLMMYSVYKLNNHGDNIQPWRTPFPIWNQPVVPCPVLTVASWPAYRFLKR